MAMYANWQQYVTETAKAVEQAREPMSDQEQGVRQRMHDDCKRAELPVEKGLNVIDAIVDLAKDATGKQKRVIVDAVDYAARGLLEPQKDRRDRY